LPTLAGLESLAPTMAPGVPSMAEAEAEAVQRKARWAEERQQLREDMESLGVHSRAADLPSPRSDSIPSPMQHLAPPTPAAAPPRRSEDYLATRTSPWSRAQPLETAEEQGDERGVDDAEADPYERESPTAASPPDRPGKLGRPIAHPMTKLVVPASRYFAAQPAATPAKKHASKPRSKPLSFGGGARAVAGSLTAATACSALRSSTTCRGGHSATSSTANAAPSETGLQKELDAARRRQLQQILRPNEL
jgi:hypothetical protein